VVLLDAQRVGWGASGRNGGQVGSGMRRSQDWLERSFGRERARALWDMGEEAKALVRALVARHAIACDLKPGVLHAMHKPGFMPEARAEAEKLARDYGYHQLRVLERDELRAALGTAAYHGGVLDMGAMHLHPLNFALGLARAVEAAGARIFERTRAASVEAARCARVVTEAGAVTAEHLVVACNGYLGGLLPETAGRVMPINNFIGATEPLGAAGAQALIREDWAVADSRFVVNYFRRTPDHRLLFGGGESYGYRFPRDIAAKVRRPMLGVFPQLEGTRIDYAWGGTLAITMNRLPAFRRFGRAGFAVGGYSGHGVALAMLAGQLIAEAVQGTAERFDLLGALPQPPFPGGAALRWPLLVLAMTWYGLRDRV
jgi:gamma-glutamylputrescine oxidase